MTTPGTTLESLREHFQRKLDTSFYKSCRRNGVRCEPPDDLCWFCEATDVLHVLAERPAETTKELEDLRAWKESALAELLAWHELGEYLMRKHPLQLGDHIPVKLLEKVRLADLPTGTDYKALYHELLYEVAHKVPNESRHESARRIIRQHETPSSDVGQCKSAAPAKEAT